MVGIAVKKMNTVKSPDEAGEVPPNFFGLSSRTHEGNGHGVRQCLLT